MLQETDVGETHMSSNSQSSQHTGTRNQNASSCNISLAPSVDRESVCQLAKVKYSEPRFIFMVWSKKVHFELWGNKLITSTRTHNIERVNDVNIFFQCGSWLKHWLEYFSSWKFLICRLSELYVFFFIIIESPHF